MWYAATWGVGVSPDSAEYIAAARRLHSLPDLFKLPTQWAPAYPLLLKLGFLSGLEIKAATRVLQCLLLAGNLAAAMTLLRHVCGRLSWLPLLGGVVLLCSFNLWQVNFYAWSEGPFLLCQQLSLLCLLRFIEAPNNLRQLSGAALLAATALMFRYAGVAWIGAAALVLLVLPAVHWQQRIRNAFAFGMVAVLPFLLWIIVNHFVRNETTNRELVVHLVTGADLQLLLLEVLSWLGLVQPNLVSAITLVATVAVLWLTLRAYAQSSVRLQWLVVVSVCHAVVYILFILLSKSFFDAYIPFDERIFVSAWLFILLMLLCCAIEMLGSESRKKWVAALALLMMLGSGLLNLWPSISTAHERGTGYLSAYMAQVSRIEDVAGLDGKIVYSNAPDYLRMQTGLNIREYPRKYAPTTQLANPDYGNELKVMQQNVQAGQALLVHYQGFEWRTYFPGDKELNALGYQMVLRGNGVGILGLPADGAVQAGAK